MLLLNFDEVKLSLLKLRWAKVGMATTALWLIAELEKFTYKIIIFFNFLIKNSLVIKSIGI